MTVIAYKDGVLATDRQVTSGGLIGNVTKIRRLADGSAIAWTGGSCLGLVVARWVERGALEAEMPHLMDAADAPNLIHITTALEIRSYEQGPLPLVMQQKFYAHGSGSAYALGAMAAGASAYEAVEIANKWCSTCGGGVDALRIEKRKRK